MRRAVGEAVKSNSVYKEEDTVVPRAELPKLLKGVKEIGQKHGFNSVCYGHAGDGNLHINIIKGDMSDDAWNNDLHIGIRELFKLTVELGGTISGEHGIGLVQKNYMDIAFTDENLNLQKGIKTLFDPKGIQALQLEPPSNRGHFQWPTELQNTEWVLGLKMVIAWSGLGHIRKLCIAN